MKFHFSLFTSVILAGLISVSIGQETAPQPQEASVTTPSTTPAFPYSAEITGNDVLVRSGPGINYYQCSKLYKGDKVTVVGQQSGVWSKIIPPAGSFSWISKEFVKIDPENQSIGTVTGDNVRVYAGSDYVPPKYVATQQGKLNKGDTVKLLGEQIDEYYKIAIPSLPDAYLWVSTQYTKPIAPAVNAGTVINATPTVKPPIEPNDANSVAAVSKSEEADVNAPLNKYYEIKKQMEAEQAKPIDQQDYTSIKAALTEITKNKDAGKAARYAEAVIKQVEDFDLALEVGKAVKLQNEQLQKTKEQIEKAHTQKLAEIKDLGRFAVIGKLQNFKPYGPGHFRIVDENDKTICTALPSEQSAGKDFNSLVGKKVGLIGTIAPNTQTAGAMVRFDDVVSLE